MSKLRVTSVESIESFFKDKFSLELFDLWRNRDLKGEVLIYFDTKPIGFILVEIKDDEVVNRGFYVDNNFQGQGIGKNLLEFLHERYSNRFIWTNISEGSEKIYEKFGYVTVGRRESINQTIAYYPHSKVNTEKLNNLKSKIDK